MYSIEAQARIEQLRLISQQRDLTDEEQREIIRITRAGRAVAAQVSSKARTAKKAQAAKPSGADVLAKLQAMMSASPAPAPAPAALPAPTSTPAPVPSGGVQVFGRRS